jgi:hypothetical protein
MPCGYLGILGEDKILQFKLKMWQNASEEEVKNTIKNDKLL